MRESEVSNRFSAEVDRLENLSGADISWKQAVDRLQANNLELQRSRNSVISAEVRLKRILLDLVPGVSFSGSLNQSITELANLSSDNVALSIYSFLNIPGIVQLRANYYASSLELIRARWAYELTERELTIRLRELFLQYDLSLQRRRTLAAALRFQSMGGLEASLEVSPESIERESSAWDLERQQSSIQRELAKLIGDSSHNWRPKASTAPTFSYAESPPSLKNTSRIAVLIRQLQAVELEGARVRELGVKLRYWPDLSLNLSGPPLIQNSGGTTNTVRAEDFYLNMNSGVQFDTKGTIAQDLAEVRRQIELARRTMDESNTDLILSLNDAKRELALNRKQIRLNDLRLEALRGLPRSLDPQKNREQLDRILSLDNRRAELGLEQAALEARFWLVDESRWKRTTWKGPLQP